MPAYFKQGVFYLTPGHLRVKIAEHLMTLRFNVTRTPESEPDGRTCRSNQRPDPAR